MSKEDTYILPTLIKIYPENEPITFAKHAKRGKKQHELPRRCYASVTASHDAGTSRCLRRSWWQRGRPSAGPAHAAAPADPSNRSQQRPGPEQERSRWHVSLYKWRARRQPRKLKQHSPAAIQCHPLEHLGGPRRLPEAAANWSRWQLRSGE